MQEIYIFPMVLSTPAHVELNNFDNNRQLGVAVWLPKLEILISQEL